MFTTYNQIWCEIELGWSYEFFERNENARNFRNLSSGWVRNTVKSHSLHIFLDVRSTTTTATSLLPKVDVERIFAENCLQTSRRNDYNDRTWYSGITWSFRRKLDRIRNENVWSAKKSVPFCACLKNKRTTLQQNSSACTIIGICCIENLAKHPILNLKTNLRSALQATWSNMYKPLHEWAHWWVSIVLLYVHRPPH